MLFSVIIPVYNVREYLRKCVKSVCDQSYTNIEIILVDDGSTDDCPGICDTLGRGDSRIVVIHKENGGLSDARNKGLEVATGDYIIFVDSDDYIEASACERFMAFAQSGCDILIGDAIVEGSDCDLKHIEKKEVLTGKQYLLESAQAKMTPMAAWLNVYKRDFLLRNNLRFKVGILHEDEDFTPRCFLAAKTVIYTGIPFYHYVFRENSISTKKDKRKNIADFYNTCVFLSSQYDLLDEPLRKMLLDGLVNKYLGLYSSSQAYKYGREYVHKSFCRQNARCAKTKLKALLFNLSPRLYCFLCMRIYRKI